MIKPFKIKCLNPQCIGGRIEVSIFGDSGYSNWTVLDNGAIEFKCHGCGKFASTDDNKKPNEPANFSVTCPYCGETGWKYHLQDVDESCEPSNIECESCGYKQYETHND